ncbi:putative hemolysin [Povalibacter uvarum]|uniref:Putative hemolysin n=1 Tax=Povalibacter uvarum TaxID=732238 RepID=A0A841HWD6_9GAMM|nr:hemolysin family protein [Povalibacter uvarum]MBB6096559.1 putative hemolysin [Povalibacter uvarum]
MPTGEIVVILLLILLNGFFALSEMALVSAKRTRLQAAAEQGRSGAKSALALTEDPTVFLSAIQIGITLIGILTGMYSGAALQSWLTGVLTGYGIAIPYIEIDDVAFGIIVVLVTFFSLIVGELVPKRVALTHAESLAMFVAPVMRVFAKIMAYPVRLLRGSVNLVLKILPVSSASQGAVTEDDVRALVAEGTHAGVFLASERRLLEGVMALADRKVGSIMVPRQDVIWLDLEEPLESLWQQAKESGHARFLVARGKLDNLLGMISLADLSEVVHRGRLDAERDLQPPLHIPDSLSVLQMLDQFQKSSTHLAIVTDEYGEIEGITTPIDILKAIAGELPELGSRERPEALQREDSSWLVDGHLSIEELQQRLGRRDMVGRDYHTVAGFVLARLGRIPKAGDTLTWRDLKIEIMDMDGVRIDKVLLKAGK